MTTRVTSKGKVTIPKAIRVRLGLQAGSRVSFELAPDGRVVLMSHGAAPLLQGFARLQGIAGAGMTTDEVMALTRGEV